MVVIDAFRKQILYQRLNLGYECTFCKRKFYSKREHFQHLQEFHYKPQKKEHIQCSKCGKVFGHIHIYQLHQQIHALSESDTNNLENTKNEQQITDEITTVTKKSATESTSAKQRQKITAKKAVGLTKIKMEDCLRCDECSCIYIDRNDYYKHMRNFHKVNINVGEQSVVDATCASVMKPTIASDPVSSKPSSQKMCKSCCKHCRDNRSSKESCRHQHLFHRAERILQPKSSTLFRYSMQDNIKDRWSKMVSQRLLEMKEPAYEDTEIKPDPDATDQESCNSVIDSEEMSHLLSQVEVRIKIEPSDDR